MSMADKSELKGARPKSIIIMEINGATTNTITDPPSRSVRDFFIGA
jgi:hypothetical protein